jgi:hypothetical protein
VPESFKKLRLTKILKTGAVAPHEALKTPSDGETATDKNVLNIFLGLLFQVRWKSINTLGGGGPKNTFKGHMK